MVDSMESRVKKGDDEFSEFVLKQVEEALRVYNETPASLRGPVALPGIDLNDEYDLNRRMVG